MAVMKVKGPAVVDTVLAAADSAMETSVEEAEAIRAATDRVEGSVATVAQAGR